ncbi:hypothetical protein F511_30139 [Dorcoceras hygrometricum]|uniref:CCHC-type domain-containing protein n=1 Tax=Dorcoceras hygrometricum TaxID=472368 RepID=A0A2Z7BU54_9LAMI|nr:hypothetical protein F511_30139 [Dorcoceras hygrometricum]
METTAFFLRAKVQSMDFAMVITSRPFENITKCCKPAAASSWKFVKFVELLGVHTSEACVIGCLQKDCPTKALGATKTTEQCSPSTSKSAEQFSDDLMSLFVKKFGKFMRRSFNPSYPYSNFHKSDKVSTDMKCFNCDRPGHFAADYNRPRKEDRSRDDKRSADRYKRDDKRADDRYKEDRYNRDENNDDRAVERSKERSKDRRMRMKSDKRPNRKHDRKVLMVEESTKSWADTDSESSSSSSSSSDSEQEEVHCLMADQTSDDEVFDFSNVAFTREDLVNTLNDMVKEYRKLSHSFEEVKAENADLKNSSVEPSAVEPGDTDSLKIELKFSRKTLRCYFSRRSYSVQSQRKDNQSQRKDNQSQRKDNQSQALRIQSQALVQDQEKKKQAKRRDSISRKIQSQYFSRSAREAVVDLNQQERSS